MAPDPIMAAAMRKRPEHEQKSPIFKWMWARFEIYGDQLSQRGVDWEGMAKQFGIEGITDGRGQAPTGKTVRATFYRVRKAKGDLKPKRRQMKPKPQIRRTFHRTAA